MIFTANHSVEEQTSTREKEFSETESEADRETEGRTDAFRGVSEISDAKDLGSDIPKDLSISEEEFDFTSDDDSNPQERPSQRDV